MNKCARGFYTGHRDAPSKYVNEGRRYQYNYCGVSGGRYYKFTTDYGFARWRGSRRIPGFTVGWKWIDWHRYMKGLAHE